MKTILKRLVIITFMIILGIGSYGQENLQSIDKQMIIIDKFLRSVLRPNMPGASIIIMKEGEIILNRGYGIACIEHGIEIDSSMLFNIGSLSKQFTAVAIMTLVEEGKISLEDNIDRYLKGCPAYYKEITVRQLVNHTSGLKNYTSIPEIRDNFEKNTTIEKMIGIVYDSEPDFRPGERFSYNNSGYILLGRIIELVSGMPAEKFVTERILKPAGMERTFFARDGEIYPGQVMGYDLNGKSLTKAKYMSMTHTYFGGSMISNTEDLSKWFKALTGGKIISKSNVDLCFNRSVLNDGTETDYGLGFYIGGEGSSFHIYHGGGVWGFVAFLMYMPDEEIFVAMLRNIVDFNTNNPAGKITSRVAYMVSEKQQQRKTITIDPGNLEKYCGEYKLEKGALRKITIIENRIYFESPTGNEKQPWARTELIPGSDSTFYVKGSMSFFRFSFDKEEKVKAFEVIQPAGGAKIYAVKSN